MPDTQIDNPLSSLPPGIFEAVNGLLLLGHLEETFELASHTFTLRTLKMSEELEAALLAKEYLDSIGQINANAWAQVAAALVAVDGDENFCPPISDNKREHLRAKFRFLTNSWYPPVGKFLFDKYLTLLEKQIAAIKAVEDLSHRGLGTSWPSPDSSENRAPLEENSIDFNNLSSDIS